MNQAMQRRVFVDGNNVMGSRADGWRRDRAAAARRIVAEIALLAGSRGGVWTIVFDGPGPRDTAPSRECLTVIHAGHGGRDSADDRIVELVVPYQIARQRAGPQARDASRRRARRRNPLRPFGHA